MKTSVVQVPRKNEAKSLIAPYRGALTNLVVESGPREELVREATDLASIQISPRSLCDLELLAVGGFTPLTGFLNQADYLSVLETMRLKDGTLFPIPITLPVSKVDGLGSKVALRSPTNHLLAILEIQEIFERNPELEARQVCGTTSEDHMLVSEMRSWGKYCLSGPLRVVELPRHYDFPELRRTPAEVRRILHELGNGNVVAFHTQESMGVAEEEMTKGVAQQEDATLLIHPVVGVAGPNDIDHFTRVHTYKALVAKYYDPAATVLNLLPLAMRFAGPREAVWHAIVRRNFGANAMIVGRDYASPGSGRQGQPFYGPNDAYDLVKQFSDELGVRPVADDGAARTRSTGPKLRPFSKRPIRPAPSRESVSG